MYVPDAHDLGRDRRVADRVLARPAVAGRDEHLDVGLLDEPVVQDGPGVVGVVERGQAADRHVDDVDVGVLGGVDHALDQGVRRAARDEQADANGHELGAGGGAAHRAAEQAVRGDDAGDVGAVLARHDADVDGLDLAVDLDDERHALGDGGRRVVGAEVADVAVDLVVGHRRLVGEAQVLVDVDPDLAAAVPQDAERCRSNRPGCRRGSRRCRPRRRGRGSRSSKTPKRNEPAPGRCRSTPPAVKVGPLTVRGHDPGRVAVVGRDACTSPSRRSSARRSSWWRAPGGRG